MAAEARARALFRETYRSDPDVLVRAPGRVNIIGEHTDYNGGFVLPMAIDSDLVIAARPRDDGRVFAVSESEARPADFGLDPLEHGTGWAEYLKGIASQLDAAALVGWDGCVASDLPPGAGVSSSAALELATARVFAELSGLEWDPLAMAQVGHRGDNEWVGINSGIMDQLICATGRAGHARLIDCRDLTGPHVPIPEEAEFVLLDTSTRRRLLDSAYNDRRAACEAAARHLGVTQLREVSPDQLTADLPPELLRRARHVVGENARTPAAADALGAGDLAEVGRLMNDSHASLRDDFEVSSPALDAMAKAAQAAPGCFGARQMGGGFAGSCIALVATSARGDFTAATLAEYARTTSHTGTAMPCRAAAGASTIEL